MSRKVLVPHITKVELPEARQAIPHVHAYLRERILDGTLRPGTKLSQVSLAEQLGISRTPLREVLRMLQEEGLVQIEPNQRTRVSVLDPRELDEIYASRVVLESLAVAMTVGNFDADAREQAAEQLVAMRAAAEAGETERWFVIHSAFHRTITRGAGDTMQKQLRQLADRCVRYIRIYQGGEPNSWQEAGDREHAQILSALEEGAKAVAQARMAGHLAHTALKVLSDTSPDYQPTAVPLALEMVGVPD
ncbi:GntR family transcriptional regulator [Nocardia tengchongensis]|uniref:GntR family transcriptional regulator n=1 Tax=Nocardia tengchongensis TaxID=2055889 RepID=UPI00369DAC49